MVVALLATLLLATWSLSHRYKGLSQDGELYAFQAMARLNPALRADVYLMTNSQDEFTLFSPLYATLIRCLGLWNGSVALFAFCTFTFIGATWSLARSLWDETHAWLCAATCIVIVCGYGAYGVFTYSESYLTARSMAEAMVIVALTCHLRGLSRWSWTIAAVSMLVHPLMALPGLLLLICLSVPVLYAGFGALAGILATLIIALLAPRASSSLHFLTIITGPWLEMIWERSQYLFLQNWRLPDWEAHARPLLCLTISIMSAEQRRVRRLCIGGMLVGVTGLTVALISSNIGPVAILLQGQAWRWFWVTGSISVLMLAPTALRLWKEGGCGATCATLLVASWTFPPANGTLFAAVALGFWCLRQHLQPRERQLLQVSAYALIAAVLTRTFVEIWSLCTSSPPDTAGQGILFECLRSVYSLQIPALLVFGLCLRWLRSGPNAYLTCAVLALLVTLCVFTMQGSFIRNYKSDTSTGMAPYEWRAAIPPTSNVLVVPNMTGAGFVWFTLQRPSYLTVNQSAGVVFSQQTAQEIRRRSDVLRTIMAPDWKIKSQLASAKKPEQTHPLMEDQLSTICRDRQLGFVIAKERLAFDAIQSTEPGRWRDWNLYDCRRVRQQASTE
jgi:hypothetical protein